MYKYNFATAHSLNGKTYQVMHGGYLVDVNGAMFFTYRNGATWFVCDTLTGMAIASAGTRKEAVASAHNAFNTFINLTATETFKKARERYENSIQITEEEYNDLAGEYTA